VFAVSLKNDRKYSPYFGYVDRERHGLVPVFSDREIAFGIAICAVVDAATPICVDFEAMEALLAILRFKKLHCSLKNYATPRLFVAKLFMEAIVYGIVEGVSIGARNLVSP
jgi:hypothetical protein